MDSAPVRLIGLAKRFGGVHAVRGLDLEVEAGELVVLLGPSGCGKTTVLRMIAGLEDATEGEIHIGGDAVTHVDPAARDIAMVFQNYALYPHMTVRANLAFGLRMRGLRGPDLDAKVEWAAAMLDLNDLLDRRPAQLSGGQKQRVALGRALVREPRVFLFDEPLSNLDARLRLETRAEIAELHRRLGTTMIFVTHDQVEAMTLGDRVAVMKGGTLQQFATPLHVYREPANLFVAQFVGTPSINLIRGAVHTTPGGSVFRTTGLDIAVPPVPPDPNVTLGVRPEAVALTPHDTPLADLYTTIRRVEALGNEILVYVDGPNGVTWTARVDAETEYAVDDRVGVRIDRERIHLFDAGGARLEVSRA